MTIGAAWISKGNEGEEVWIASDSRLTDSENIWDHCPKLILLPRRDAVAGFSGGTAQAYPILLQLASTIGSYRAATDGTLEFLQLVRHLERVVNEMMGRIEADPSLFGSPSRERQFASYGDALILGGFSRMKGAMVIRVLRYQNAAHRWQFTRPG